MHAGFSLDSARVKYDSISDSTATPVKHLWSQRNSPSVGHNLHEGSTGCRRDGGGGDEAGHGGGHVGVDGLISVLAAAVSEGADALDALGDVERAPRARVPHGDVSEAVHTAATQKLVLVLALERSFAL